MPKLKPLFIERNGYMWNEAGFKAVEQDKILHPTRPLCLTFSAAGRFGSIEVSERGKGRHMADVRKSASNNGSTMAPRLGRAKGRDALG